MNPHSAVLSVRKRIRLEFEINDHRLASLSARDSRAPFGALRLVPLPTAGLDAARQGWQLAEPGAGAGSCCLALRFVIAITVVECLQKRDDVVNVLR
jgi:hypothetical protein